MLTPARLLFCRGAGRAKEPWFRGSVESAESREIGMHPVSPAYRAIDEHLRYRLRQWLRAKHQLQGRVEARFPDAYLHGELGLTQLAPQTRRLPWATT